MGFRTAQPHLIPDGAVPEQCWSSEERAPVHSGHGHQAAHTVLVLCATDVRWIAAFGGALCFGYHKTYILWQPKILLTLFYLG